MPFEDYYDEALDTNISGRRQLATELKARNLVPIGDRVGGAIDWDKNAPKTITRVPPTRRGATGVNYTRTDAEIIVDGQTQKVSELPDVGAGDITLTSPDNE
jgi:hypothetical protein